MTRSVDESYRFLAAQYVGKQSKRLAEQLDGVRKGEDIECVHQARVASRRLRAALGMFGDCFPAKQVKRWRKQVRRVTTELGDARDKDVQIEYLCGMLGALVHGEAAPGIARLLVKLEQKRERLQPKVIQAVDRLQASEVIAEMQAAIQPVLSDAKARGISVQSPYTYRQTRQHVRRRLDELLPYQESLAHPDDQPRHHAMRIAAKRLRYTVEIAKPVYLQELDGTIDAIKRVQTLLGDVHDCDVWVEHLGRFAKKERKRIRGRFGRAAPFARLEVGIEFLCQERREKRQRVFQELVDYWSQLDRQGSWEHLARVLDRPLQEADAPRGAAEPAETPPTEPDAAQHGPVALGSADE